MKQIKEVLRLKYCAGLSNRDIARCLKIGASTVSELLTRCKSAGLGWPLDDGITDTQLSSRLYPQSLPSRGKRPLDFPTMHRELKRPAMTKLLLWQEYYQDEPESAYHYSQFCELYGRWINRQKRSMRQHHRAGEKLFIDFCGPTVPIVNPETGETYPAQIFVATLGASNYTYVEACRSQNSESWLMAHCNAFEFFGGVPQILVPDNLKAAVTKADRYEPVLNQNYARLARHYNTVVIPARPYKPKDKAKAENAVLIVERWILMRLRNQLFHSLGALNQALKQLLAELSDRPQRILSGSRRELFDHLDKPALLPLPSYRYEYVDSRRAKVGPDYHILYQKHAYSVPHALVGEPIELEASARLVRLYHRGQLIAQHPRSHKPGGFSTVDEHMPQSHQSQRWSPERLLGWGANIGPGTREVVAQLLRARHHPEQAYRSCLGLLNLSRQYSNAGLENACQKALLLERPQLKTVRNLLKRPGEVQGELPLDNEPPAHTNLRGPGYFN
ncbi:IS21 family transposase [Ferrimonas sediminicola]|uniref:IS21 family transposase n=2 Tax=Ferrimonas sediminicola TaxID=2569538 RepID=A0A4V5NYI7_9GAMM|nr:IS21 family transposase [Ferrimonas sediminicola]